MTTQFNGFPQQGLQFLVDLGQNNNKAWFDQHKPEYQQNLLEPAQDFIEAIGHRLHETIPGIRYDLRTNGSGSLMRIYRDVRFSKDKTPYKTSLAGMWWLGAGKKTKSPAFGFHIESKVMESMAGMFQFDKIQLEKYRQAVAGPQGEELAAIVDKLLNAGYHFSDPTYKRVPKAFPPDHPRANLLRHSNLYVNPTHIPTAILTSPDLVDVLMQHFMNMLPVLQWLSIVIN